MKIRNGFVSNSSSSSFLIISKNGELTQEKIMKSFDVKEGSPLFTLAKGIARDMNNSSRKYTCEEYKKDYMWGDYTDEDFKNEYPEMYELYEKSKENDWTIYQGSADSCDEPTLCELELYYEDSDIKIEKDGSY